MDSPPEPCIPCHVHACLAVRRCGVLGSLCNRVCTAGIQSGIQSPSTRLLYHDAFLIWFDCKRDFVATITKLIQTDWRSSTNWLNTTLTARPQALNTSFLYTHFPCLERIMDSKPDRSFLDLIICEKLEMKTMEMKTVRLLPSRNLLTRTLKTYWITTTNDRKQLNYTTGEWTACMLVLMHTAVHQILLPHAGCVLKRMCSSQNSPIPG
jgi:hypothetical protein